MSFNQRPCKFGAACNKYQTGNCTFLHDNNGPQQPQSNQGGRGGRGGRGGGQYQNQYPSNIPNTYQGGNMGGQNGQGGQGGQGGQFGQGGQGGQGGRGGRGTYPIGQPQQNGDISFEFCKFFHTQECTKNPCKKFHAFTRDDCLKRVLKIKEVPNTSNAKLCTLEANGIKYFTLKLDNIVSIFQYNPENQQNPIVDLGQNYMLENSELHFFDTHQKYIYFAYENKTTSFTNIGFIDAITKQKVLNSNAHKLKVTGIVHITDINNQPLVLSSSIEGTIKVWRVEVDKMVLNSEITDAIQKCYNPNNSKNFQILFLSKQFVSGKQVLAAGTSDNRLLFWIGNQLSFQTVTFPGPYNKVLSIKYIKNEADWIAMSIIWKADLSMCSVMALSLSNMQFQSVIEEPISNQRNLFRTMESIGGLLLLGNMMGMVSIYKIPNFGQKIGCIMHQNCVEDMVSLTSCTSNGIEMNNLLVLQKLEGNKQGSFSIFTLR